MTPKNMALKSTALLAFMATASLSTAQLPQFGSLGNGLFPNGVPVANDHLYIPAALNPNATGTISTYPNIKGSEVYGQSASTEGSPPEDYTWRVNISSIPLDVPIDSTLWNKSVIVNSVYEFIMNDTALTRISKRNNSISFLTIFPPLNVTLDGKSDTGDCTATLGTACSNALLRAFLANPRTIPSPPAACLARLGGYATSESAAHWPAGYESGGVGAFKFGASIEMTNFSLPTNATNPDANGFYFEPNSSGDPYVRFLNYSGTPSRASTEHISSPERAVGNNTLYFQALERVLPIVVAEVGGSDGQAKWGSLTCVRMKSVSNGSLTLDDYTGAGVRVNGPVGVATMMALLAGVVVMFA